MKLVEQNKLEDVDPCSKSKKKGKIKQNKGFHPPSSPYTATIDRLVTPLSVNRPQQRDSSDDDGFQASGSFPFHFGNHHHKSEDAKDVLTTGHFTLLASSIDDDDDVDDDWGENSTHGHNVQLERNTSKSGDDGFTASPVSMTNASVVDDDGQGLYFNNDDPKKPGEMVAGNDSDHTGSIDYPGSDHTGSTGYPGSDHTGSIDHSGEKGALQVNLEKFDETWVTTDGLNESTSNIFLATTVSMITATIVNNFEHINISLHSKLAPSDLIVPSNVVNNNNGGSSLSLISEWHWIWKHVTENTEKFILYVALALCLGIIGALTSALIRATHCCECEGGRVGSTEASERRSRKGCEKSYRIDGNISGKDCAGSRGNKKKKKRQEEANSVSWRIPGSESSTGDDRTLDEDDDDEGETGEAVQLANYNHIDSLQRRTLANLAPAVDAYPHSQSLRQPLAGDFKSGSPVPTTMEGTKEAAGTAVSRDTQEGTSAGGSETCKDGITRRRNVVANENADFDLTGIGDQMTLKNKQQQKMLENSQAVQNLQATLQKQKQQQQQMLQNQQKNPQQHNIQQQILQPQRNGSQQIIHQQQQIQQYEQQKQQHKQHSQLSLYSSGCNSPSQNTYPTGSKTGHSSSTAQTPLDVDSIQSSPVHQFPEKAPHLHSSPVRSINPPTNSEGAKASGGLDSHKVPVITLPLPPPTPSYQVTCTAPLTSGNINMPLPLPPPPSAPTSSSFPPFPPLPSPPPESNDSFLFNDCEESGRYVRSEFRRLETTSAKVVGSPSYASINGPITEQHLHQYIQQREQMRNPIQHRAPEEKLKSNPKLSLVNGDIFHGRHHLPNSEFERSRNPSGTFSQQNQLPPPPVSTNKPSKLQDEFSNFQANGIPRAITSSSNFSNGSHYSQVSLCSIPKDGMRKDSCGGGNLASSSMNGIFNSQYNYHTPSSSNHNATTAFNPSAVSDRSLEKSAISRQQQLMMQQPKLREGQKNNHNVFPSNAISKPLVAKKLSVDAYFSTLPSSPLPTSSYSPPEPYRPDAAASINSYHYHHNHQQHQHNASPLHQRSHLHQHQGSATNIRKSSLTGSLGRAYSGHLLYLADSERNLIGGGSLADGRDIYLSQLATAASAAREQLHLGYGIVGGGLPGSDEEARRYRTLQPTYSHYYG